MIRFIAIAIVLFIYLIVGIPVLIVEYFVGLVNRRAKDYSCLRMVQWTFRLMLKIAGVKVTVIGEENVPDEPVLYIGNHRSYFDILLTYSRCRRLTGYVAKKEMEHIPLLSTWMRFAQRVTVDNVKNVNIARKAIKKAFQNQIDGKGYSIVEVLSTCPTNWGLSPVEAVKWLEDNMIPYYPLGVYKDVEEGVKK